MNNPNQSEERVYVGFWMRVLMSIIDTIILMIVMVPVMMLLVDGSVGEAMLTGEMGGLAMLVYYLLPVVLYVLFWSKKGATPAKMLFKVKIIDQVTGEYPSIGKSVLRYIMLIVSCIPLFLGLAWVGWDKKKQGWHDKVSGTVVVKN